MGKQRETGREHAYTAAWHAEARATNSLHRMFSLGHILGESHFGMVLETVKDTFDIAKFAVEVCMVYVMEGIMGTVDFVVFLLENLVELAILVMIGFIWIGVAYVVVKGDGVLEDILQAIIGVIDDVISALNSVENAGTSVVNDASSLFGGGSVSPPGIPTITVSQLLPWQSALDRLEKSLGEMEHWYNMCFFLFRELVSDSACKYWRYASPSRILYWAMYPFFFPVSWPPFPVPDANCQPPDDAILAFVLGFGHFMIYFLIPGLLVLVAIYCYWPVIRVTFWMGWAATCIAADTLFVIGDLVRIGLWRLRGSTLELHSAHKSVAAFEKWKKEVEGHCRALSRRVSRSL